MSISIEAEGPHDLNIIDPDSYASGFPHATFERLRRTDPVSWWDETDGGKGFWAVTRYDDLLNVSRNTAVFSNAQGITLEEMEPDDFLARQNMLEYDPPELTRYRRLVSRPFSRREVMGYEAAIREIAREVVEEALPESSTVRLDVTERIAKQLPMRMLGKLLGVPDEDGPWLVERGDALLGNFDPEMTDYPVDLVNTDEFRAMPFRSPAGLDLYRYAEEQANLRRGCPMHDVINTLLQPAVDGELLSDREFKNFFVLLVGAGNDTSRYTMAAGIKALSEHPDQMRDLQRAIGTDPALVESAVEEILRYSTVTMNFRRTALHDTELHGRSIRAGDKVVIWFTSADHDHDVFENPYRFDIRRKPNEHVAFGLRSPHLCLGAQLARMEIRLLLEELLPRVKDWAVDGPIERLRSNFIGGMKHLPMTIQTR
ncbi:MAG: cytochrome P450 [Actinomycetota bacterium]